MIYTVWLCYIVLSTLKTSVWVFNFYIFQVSTLPVALCVGEIRELSVQIILVFMKCFPHFLHCDV